MGADSCPCSTDQALWLWPGKVAKDDPGPWDPAPGWETWRKLLALLPHPTALLLCLSNKRINVPRGEKGRSGVLWHTQIAVKVAPRLRNGQKLAERGGTGHSTHTLLWAQWK